MVLEGADTNRVLLVEDNPHDVRLAREAIAEADSAIELDVVADGAAAIDYLHGRGEYADASTPAFVLLDYNLPKRDGADVLSAIKSIIFFGKCQSIFLLRLTRKTTLTGCTTSMRTRILRNHRRSTSTFRSSIISNRSGYRP